jgi:hypothetical protein
MKFKVGDRLFREYSVKNYVLMSTHVDAYGSVSVLSMGAFEIVPLEGLQVRPVH